LFGETYKKKYLKLKAIFTLKHLPSLTISRCFFIALCFSMNLPYTTLSKEYQYSYLLHIVIRVTWLSKKNRVTRSDFIDSAVAFGISKRTAFRIWSDWAYKNTYIKYVSDNKDYLHITSLKSFEFIIEKVPKMYYDKIQGLSSFRDFLHYAYLWKNWVKSKWVSTGKWLRTIANNQNTTVQTICKRNKRCEKKFWLEKTNRYWVYNGFFIRLTNTYLSWIRVIRNKYYALSVTPRKKLKVSFEKFASLFKSLNSIIDKKLVYAEKELYNSINDSLYPKLT